MRYIFEKLISISSSLPKPKREYFIKLLDELNGKICLLIETNESFRAQITGVNPIQYNETLKKAIDLLKLLGFSQDEFVCFKPIFLNWIIDKTTKIDKYNPRLMNFYLLRSMQEAFFLAYAENQGEIPTYKQVRAMMLTFNEQIEEMENTLKLSLPELIRKIDGKN